jgi:hypothetical protein
MTAAIARVRAALVPLGTVPAWLAAAVDPERVAAALVRHVPALASDALDLVSCTPERVRLKAGTWSVRYALDVRDASGATRTVRLVGELLDPSEDVGDDPTGGDGTGGDATVEEDRGADDGAPALSDDATWRAWLPELRVRLHAQRADTALPALARLTDPEAAGALLAGCLSERAGAPEVRVLACRPDVVRYKPGSRCTIVYELDCADADDHRWTERVVAKTYHGTKGANAYTGMHALWQTDLARGDIVRIAEPLGYLSGDRVLVQRSIPEQRTLKDLLRATVVDLSPDMVDQLHAGLDQTADGLAALHRCGVEVGATVTLDDELAEVRELVERLDRAVTGVSAAVAPLLARMEELAARHPPDPSGPAHHSFRPAQVLMGDGGIGFIDFDNFCQGEPAMDVGLFLATIKDVGMSTASAAARAAGGAPPGTELLAWLQVLCDRFLARYEEHAPVSRARVDLWETSAVLTYALHCWQKVKPDALAAAMAVLDAQLEVLERER